MGPCTRASPPKRAADTLISSDYLRQVEEDVAPLMAKDVLSLCKLMFYLRILAIWVCLVLVWKRGIDTDRSVFAFLDTGGRHATPTQPKDSRDNVKGCYDADVFAFNGKARLMQLRYPHWNSAPTLNSLRPDRLQSNQFLEVMV